MRKSFILVLAALLVVAFTLPASAFENIFGGYWRTRMFTNEDFNGLDNVDEEDDLDRSMTDARTRLYYTAQFNENFKFVNEFEFDLEWGDDNTGDIGADGSGGANGKGLEIRASYADFRLGPTRWTVGVQPATIARGFIFGDQFSGVIARYQPGTTQDLLIPFLFGKVTEEDITGATFSTTLNGIAPGALQEGNLQLTNGDSDVNLFGLYPYFPMGDYTLNPYFVYVQTNSGAFKDSDWYYIGLDADGKIGDIGLWGTFIYNGGTIDPATVGDPNDPDIDVKGWLFAIGGNFPVGPLALRSQFFYATGEDLNDNDDDLDAFVPLGTAIGNGSTYYWSEIMGLGMFDWAASAGSPADAISNIWAFNVGSDFNITEGSKLAVDLWYASLAEDNLLGDSDLGFEVDLVYTINLVENLNLDLVGAYLFAGDATTSEGYTENGRTNEEDPYEIGARLSFSF